MTGPSAHEVYALLLTVGRKPGDGLPEAATGATLLCYIAAASEEAAVREMAAVLRDAGLAPLEAAPLGTLAEREAAGEPVSPEERAWFARAAAPDRDVVVAEVTPHYPQQEQTP